MSISKSTLLSLAALGLMYSLVVANDVAAFVTSAEPPKPENGEKDEKDKAKEKKEKDEKKKDFPEFKEVVTEDFKEVKIYNNPDLKPFYTLYHNEKTDQLLAEISSGKLDSNVILSSSIHAGPGIAGWMWGDQVVRWERRNKKLLLIAPDVRNEGKEGVPLSDAVRRTYTDVILRSIDIKTLNSGNPVIDLGDLFKQDFAKIGRVFGGTLESSLAKWIKIKCFEQNIVLTVESPYKGKGSSFLGGSAYDGTLIAVNYNLSAMPDTGYKPRHADDRIGYFTTVRRDWGKDYKQKTLFNRYVNRWHLEKQDAELDKSPVKNPIIFYVEKTVPIRFRNSVKEGILAWNEAFEKCGFLDAMQVRQQTETQYADFDPEDVTKNFFRWTTTGVGIAVGPSRANPLTGQIYDADIVFDDGWIRGPIETHAVFGAKSLAAHLNDPKLRAFLEAHPSFDFGLREDRLLPGYASEVTEQAGLQPDFGMLADRYSRYMCDCGASVQQELGMAHTIFASQGYTEIPEKFLQQIVKEVAMHEVGHTLGLRHNFKASTWLPLEDTLSTNGDEGRPMAASVMDYNAFMFHTKKELQGDHAMTSIGPYDVWAIEYGYRPVGEPFKDEEEMLKSITDRVAEAGLDYATDEDASIFDPDPLVNRRDMGTDPLEYAKYRIELVEQLFNNMDEWAVQEGESYSVMRKRFNRMLREIAFSSIYAGRFVGGQYFHRDHRGDPNGRPPFVMVSASKQREAVQFISDRVFSGELFEFEPELLSKLAPGRWGHWGSRDFDRYLEFNLHDHIEVVMRMALLPLFNPFTITRLHDMQLMYQGDEEPYTLSEHIRSLTNTIWSNLDKPLSKTYSDRDPYINSIRRGLQRAYTQQLAYFVTSPAGHIVPADANALIRMTSEQLHDKIAKVSDNRNLDDASRAHLLDVQGRLRKALDARSVQQ